LRSEEASPRWGQSEEKCDANGARETRPWSAVVRVQWLSPAAATNAPPASSSGIHFGDGRAGALPVCKQLPVRTMGDSGISGRPSVRARGGAGTWLHRRRYSYTDGDGSLASQTFTATRVPGGSNFRGRSRATRSTPPERHAVVAASGAFRPRGRAGAAATVSPPSPGETRPRTQGGKQTAIRLILGRAAAQAAFTSAPLA
jgi:hypothetical protein